MNRIIQAICIAEVIFLSATKGQERDEYLQRGQEYLQKYAFSSHAYRAANETPETSWKNYYDSLQRSEKKESLRARMMPSYRTNVTYANFLINEEDNVWGNVVGGNAPYYFWLDYGDGSKDSGVVNNPRFLGAKHLYNYAGIKRAILKVQDSQGLIDQETTYIRVFPLRYKQVRINRAIDRGLLYLYLHQFADGRWEINTGSYPVATTGAAVLCFEENGHLAKKGNDFSIYVETVTKGLKFLLSNIETMQIFPQPAGDCDSDGDGKGAYFSEHQNTYSNGIALLAILAAHSSKESAQTDTITNGEYNGSTYFDFVVDALDQLAFSQEESGIAKGGWGYQINMPSSNWSDNSIVQWSSLVLEAVQNSWGMQIPAFVKNELLAWLQISQSTNGYFTYQGVSGGNIALNGSGIGSYVFLGKNSSFSPIQNSMTYISSVWSNDTHLKGNLYAMYALAKALRIIDNRVGVLTIGTHNWYEEYSDHLLDHPQWGQFSDGSWRDGLYLSGVNSLSTSFALLILTRGVIVAPPVAIISPITPKPAGFSFDVDGSQSYHQDPDKDIVEYKWDFDSENGLNWNHPDATGPYPLNPGYEQPGTYTITLRVKDNSEPPMYAMASEKVRILSEDSLENHSPVAVPIPRARRPYYIAPIGLSVLLDGRESYDIDIGDAIVSYAWDLDGNGIFDDATTDTISVAYNEEYDGEIGLKVTDTHGESDIAYTRIVAIKQRDVYIESMEITPRILFYDGTMNIKVICRNLPASDTTFSNLVLRLFLGNPLENGVQFIEEDFLVSLPAGERDTTEISLDVPASWEIQSQYIYAYLDANRKLREHDETNNIKSTRVEMGYPSAIYIRKLKDNDGNIRTISDRTPFQWKLSLYKDSISANTLLTTTTASSLIYPVNFSGKYIAVEKESATIGTLTTFLDGEEKSNTNAISFFSQLGKAHVVEFVNFESNTAIVRTFADGDGNFFTTSDRTPLLRKLSLYRTSTTAQNLIATVASDSVLSVGNLPNGLYIAVQEPSNNVGWSLLGNEIINQNGTMIANENSSYIISFNVKNRQTIQAHFINSNVMSITVRKIIDDDGNLFTANDRRAKKWGMKLYKNSILPEHLIGAVASDTILIASGITAGNYFAVESDSMGYVQIGYQFKNEPSVRSSQQQIPIQLAEGARVKVDFINFLGDTLYFRTFRSDSAIFSAKPRLLSATVKPNSGNVRETVMVRKGGDGIFLGKKAQTKSENRRIGWIRIEKVGTQQFLPQTARAQFFDSIRLAGKKTKVFIKEMKNPTNKKYNNHLAGEMFALAFNMKASEAGTFPSNFSSLVYNDGMPNNPFNGMSIRNIKRRLDSVVSYWKNYPQVNVDAADSVVARINRAFFRPLADSDFLPTYMQYLVVKGAKSVFDVPYLHLPAARETEEEIEISETFPEQMLLEQNYPNPFNPFTLIRYSFIVKSVVTLKIYNVLGQEVATLLNNVMQDEGRHEIEFDASDLSSGVYFYRISISSNSGTFVQMKKMVIVK